MVHSDKYLVQDAALKDSLCISTANTAGAGDD